MSETRSVTFCLPFPPSVNTYWRTFKGRMLLSERGRVFRTEVAASILQNGFPEKMTGRLKVQVVLCPPDKRRRDLDNSLKGILDSLQHAGVYRDDEQIDDLHVMRGEVTPNGEALVIVESIPLPER